MTLQQQFERAVLELTQANAALAHSKELYKKLVAKYQILVRFYDDQVGTPCEQIRHQQEVDDLKEKLQEQIKYAEGLEQGCFIHHVDADAVKARIEWLEQGCFLLMSVMNGRGVDRDSAERKVYDEWRKGGHFGVSSSQQSESAGQAVGSGT